MDSVDCIENLWSEQPYKQAQPNFFTPPTGNNTLLDFQDLFWLHAALIEYALLHHSGKLIISIHSLAKQLSLSTEHTLQGICYLQENGYLETLGLYLKIRSNFILQSKPQSLVFHKEQQ